VKIYDAQTDLINNSIDLSQRFTSNANPIKGVLLAWKDDNEAAMKAYFMANAEAISNSIDGEDIFQPLEDWLLCEALVFSSLPGEVFDSACSVKEAYTELNKLLDDVKNLNPLAAEINKIINDIKGELVDLIEDEALSFANSVTGTDIKSLISALNAKPNASNLNAQFNKSSGNTNLVKIPNFSNRVNSEMNLSTNNTFDESSYSVIYNSLILSKLSLLDSSQLNKLVGRNMYSDKTISKNNILFRFAHSIDGDHHWLKISPDYPRSDGNHVSGGEYGYEDGFPLWKLHAQRNKVFRKLFKGPLNSGFRGDDNGVKPVKLHNYPYNPTESCAFPNNGQTSSCRRGLWPF